MIDSFGVTVIYITKWHTDNSGHTKNEIMCKFAKTTCYVESSSKVDKHAQNCGAEVGGYVR